jgi:hypothetical protein
MPFEGKMITLAPQEKPEETREPEDPLPEEPA